MDRERPAGQPNIAVIGYGVRLPGATGRDAFWRLLSERRCAISDIPSDRFPTSSFYHPHAGSEVPGRSYTFAAGLIDDVWDFDPDVFGISPREAAQIDPQQRHLLEVTYEAIEHAGLRLSALAGETIGVYVGASSSDHATRFMFDPGAVDMHMMTGNTLSLISNRLSYAFDLHGPSFTVDTACSSSLVAMHVALEAIREGKIDTAIVGGVNMLLAPFSFLGFSRASMLSPTGLCRAFDAQGDGYVRGEGAVALVLRSEDAARRNGDRVHALVVGSGTNQDGRTVGLSLPSTDAQAALLKDVYASAGIAPDDLAFIEAHGTGTKVGDPAEAAALGRILGQRRSSALPIGSVKTNIGHLEPASGLAGVVKSIMALEHEILPASLHFTEPNPDIAFDELNLRVAGQSLQIPRGRRPRYAGVNSFGFGGSNAHVVLREPDPVAPTKSIAHAPLILSAHNAASLTALANRYADVLQQGDAALVANAAAHTRDRLPERMVVSTPLRDRLVKGGPGVWQGTALGTDLDVAFVFSGNGAQWAGMGLAAYNANAGFQRALTRFDQRFAPVAGWSVIESLHSPELPIEIRRASRAQPLLLAVQVAIVEALRERGLEPSAAIGHSVGEVAAAWCAGALDIDGAIRVILARSQRQEITRYRGAMAAVLVSASDMKALLDHGAFPQLEIAAINSGRSVTVAGPREVLEGFLKYAEQERWRAKRLDLDYPFHCALVDPIETQLVEDLDGLTPTASRIPFVSTVTGTTLEGSMLDARYWWRNVREPVNFAGGITTLIDNGTRLFLEVGPHPVLGGYLHEALRSSSVQGAAIPTLSRDPDAESDEILASASRTLIAGGLIDIDRFAGPAQRPAAELPNYVWQHRRFKVERTGEALSTFATAPHPLLGQATRPGSGAWYATVDPLVLPWLGDHRVEDAAVFPAAGFIEVALAAARETFGEVALEVRDLEILQPLVFNDERSFEIATRLSTETSTIEMRSRPRPSVDDFSLNAKATIGPAPVSEKLERFIPLVKTSLDSREVYALAQRRGLSYGPAFRRIAAVEILDMRSARAMLGSCATRIDGFVLDPTALDAAFHILIALAERDSAIDPNALLLPVRAGSLRVYRPGAFVASASVRVTSSTPRSQVADFLLFDQAGALIAELRDARCRVVPRSVKETQDDLVYRMGFEPLYRASLPSVFAEVCLDGPARTFSDAARTAGRPAEQSDVALVLEAGARVAAYDAISNLMGQNDRLVLADLVADGKVALSAWPLLSQMLIALADLGHAREREEGWTLGTQPDVPTIAELVDVLVTRYPSWIAEATCLARLPELLPALLREGLDQGLGFSQAVIEHLESGSPAFTRLADVIYQGAAEVLERWPADRALRILVVGASNLPLAAKLAAKAPRAAIVVADPRSEFLDTARRSPFNHERLRMTTWDQAIDPGTGYDLILCAGSLNCVVAAPGRFDMMARTLCTGGALIAAEPLPSLFRDLVYGQTPDWWTRSVSPDFPTGMILPERDWGQTLQQAGLTDETVHAIDGGVLISAVNTHDRTAPAADIVSRSVLIVADAEVQTFADLLQQRLQHTARVVPFHSADGRSQQRVRKVMLADVSGALRSGQPVTDIAFVANARSPNASVEALTRPLTAMIQLATAAQSVDRLCLWIVCSGALSGIADDRSPNPIQTGLWMAARVIQNEFPNIDVRCIDLDPQLALDVAASRAAEAIAHPSADREVVLGSHSETALRVLRGGVLADRLLGEGVRLEFTQTGVFDSFVWRSRARTVLAPGEVEIAVTATGLNFRDVMWSLGLLPDEALENGFTGPAIGMECSGIVSAVGAEVTNLRVGERVVAFTSGGFASNIVVDSRMAARIPDDISLESAATLPVAFLTAYYALVHLAQIQPGETVLIHGGAGGVGLAALQIARLRGAKVIATAGSADRRTLLQTLGAEHVFDSRSLSFADEVRRVCGGVDVVLNSLAGEAMERSVDCLKPFGRFLELGKRDFYQNRHLGLRPFRNNLSYFGIDADQLLLGHRALTQRMFAELMDLFADGQLAPLPYRVFDAENASDAFRLMQRSGQIGKILIRPPRSRPRVPATSGFEIDPQGLYLIVGGLGGFGLATAQWLVSKGARHLALMSRSGLPTAECSTAIAGLKASGAAVGVIAVDVTDAVALERYFWTLGGGPPLKGVFHAAMVLDDGFAADLDRSRIETVLRPKVAGATNLDRLTRRFDLDCFVLYSSVAAMIGNVGQASYVAANGYLDGLARRRRAEGLPALAVGFGAIGDVGYLARHEQVGAALSQRLGRSTLTAAEALSGLEALLQGDPHDVSAAAVVFARVDWALARKELKLVRSPLFASLQLDDIAGDGSSFATAELLQRLRDMPDIEVQVKLADLIAESIVRTLRLPAGEIARDRPLSEFGMDSLMMLELRMAVEEQMGIEIPLMSLTSSLTVAEISKRLTGILRSQDKALMSGQMSVLAQEHVEIPAALSEAEVAATAAAVARRAKSVDRIL